MPPACGEGAGAAVPPVPMQPPPRELSPHVRIPDAPGRTSVWREHGNLCWEEKQLGECLEMGALLCDEIRDKNIPQVQMA